MNRESITIARIRRGSTVTVRTRNTTYLVSRDMDGVLFIEGHPKHCPDKVPVDFANERLVVGYEMWFNPSQHSVVSTSPIVSISTE